MRAEANTRRPWRWTDSCNANMGMGGGGGTVNPIKLQTGLRTTSAGIPYTLLLRIEAIGFPTLGLLL